MACMIRQPGMGMCGGAGSQGERSCRGLQRGARPCRPSSKGRGLCTSSRARDSHTHSRRHMHMYLPVPVSSVQSATTSVWQAIALQCPAQSTEAPSPGVLCLASSASSSIFLVSPSLFVHWLVFEFKFNFLTTFFERFVFSRVNQLRLRNLNFQISTVFLTSS